MNVCLLILAALAAFFILPACKMFAHDFNEVVDHFEEDEAIARGQGL